MESRSLPGLVVTYLGKIHDTHPRYFNLLFSQECGISARLFYDHFGCVHEQLIQDLNAAITTEWQHQFIAAFAPVNPVLHAPLVTQLRKVASDFFMPVSSTPAWQDLWLTITTHTVTSPAKQQALLHLITGAFAFKVLSMAIQSTTDLNAMPLTIQQRIFFPKVLSWSDDDNEAGAHIISLRDEFFGKIFQGALDYKQIYGSALQSRTAYAHSVLRQWESILKIAPHDPRFKSQGDLSHLALNQWLIKAVDYLKQLGRNHASLLQELCQLIYAHVQTNYGSNNVCSESVNQSAIVLVLSTLDVAEIIRDNTISEQLRQLHKLLFNKPCSTANQHFTSPLLSPAIEKQQADYNEPGLRKSLPDRKLCVQFDKLSTSPRSDASLDILSSSQPLPTTDDPSSSTHFLKKSLQRTRSLLGLRTPPSPPMPIKDKKKDQVSPRDESPTLRYTLHTSPRDNVQRRSYSQEDKHRKKMP